MELRDNGAGGVRNSPVRFFIKGDGLRETYNGYGEGLTLAFEIALVPTIFGAIGFGIDSWLGILPAFTIILALLGIVGLSIRLFCDYATRMKTHDAEGAWARSAQPATPIQVPPVERGVSIRMDAARD